MSRALSQFLPAEQVVGENKPGVPRLLRPRALGGRLVALRGGAPHTAGPHVGNVRQQRGEEAAKEMTDRRPRCRRVCPSSSFPGLGLPPRDPQRGQLEARLRPPRPPLGPGTTCRAPSQENRVARSVPSGLHAPGAGPSNALIPVTRARGAGAAGEICSRPAPRGPPHRPHPLHKGTLGGHGA